jgi:MSHA biogenesis protein MshQ
LTGGGALTDIDTEFSPVNVDGLGSYIFFGTEELVQLQFNYTSPAVNGEAVNFNIGGEFSEQQAPDHDPDIDFDQVGLLFFDEVGGSTTLPIQIAGKPSLEAPVSGNITLQLIRSVAIGGENPAVACESLIPDQTTAAIQFAGVCEDPGTCAVANMTITDVLAAPQSVPVFNTGTVNPAASGQSVDVFFENQPTVVNSRNNIGATLNFTYPDAGKISLHAQFDIPFDDDISGVRSGDRVENGSETFIVRPFAFDVDFGDDRLGGGAASLATDANGPAFARAGAGFDTTVSAIAWEATDDSNDDGIPDFEADLSNNAVTTNFGQETGISDHTIRVSVVTDDPGIPGAGDNPGVPGGQLGQIVQGAIFDGFVSGVSIHSIAIDEVGIFDLRAQLVQTADQITPEVYFEEVGSQNVDGGVGNVGRIYPFNFELSNSSFGPRVNQSMACVATSPFTYLGEDFGISFQINAKNALGNDTQNYIGDFAKLTSLAELDIRAIQDVVSAADNDLTGARLVNSTMAANFGGGWTNGILNLMGDMHISRQASGVEDGPFVGLQIAFGPIDDNDDGSVGGNADNDVLLDTFDVDLDDGVTEPGTNVLRLINSHEFRYGRMLLENSFGPETEPLDIPLRVEYWDGAQFITNLEDDCTSIFYNVTEALPANRTMSYVTAAGSYEAPLADGDTEIEASEVADVTLNLFNGVMTRLQDGDNNDANDPDRPFLTSAPGEDNEGSVIVEFDLGDANLPTSLDFLQYDWRTPGDVEDETEDNIYTDNPRSRLEFGSFRSHDRVLNWQEFYIAPTP